MDILNFISWIKNGEYRATLPTDTTNLIAIGAKDPTRDDGYRPMAVNATPLQSLYVTGAVTQATSITTSVTLNTLSGVITTVSSTLAAGASAIFVLNNTYIKDTSKILLTVEYLSTATGIPVVRTSSITGSSGAARIVLSNAAAAAALNDVVRIHFLIIQ